MLANGACFDYTEVYGHKDEDVFPFGYRGAQYAVAEQYCLNPACKCNEVVTSQPVRKAPPVGRNDPCPCGSGKKYKKCCLI